MPGAKLPILTITNRQYFRDDGMYIDGLTDGTLNITSDSAITLDGNVSLTSDDTFTIVDGVVNLGTGALTLGGTVAFSDLPTLANAKYFTTATTLTGGDGTYASGLQGNVVFSSNNAWPSAQGWIRHDIGSFQGYIPIFSGNALKPGVQPA